MKVKPGKADEFIALNNDMGNNKPKGMVAVHVYRMDSNPDEFMLAVLFQDKESYVANANSPEQDKEYQAMRALLAQDPHWHDGEVIQSIT
jgi:quinol monooxygenase YgiN